MLNQECPVCRNGINPFRSIIRPGWSRWRCPACDSLIGISFKRRLLVTLPWVGIVILWLIGQRTFRLPYAYTVPFLIVSGMALYMFFEKMIIYERCGFRCKDCGYDLRGQSAPCCPECGRAFDDEETRRMNLARPEELVVRTKSGRFGRWPGIAIVTLLLLTVLLQGIFVFNRASRRAQVGPIRRVLDTLLVYTASHNGDLPPHAITIAGDDYLGPSIFIADGGGATSTSIPTGETPLPDFARASTERQAEIAGSLIDALPDDLVAHRLGDFVFTYHGIDLASADADLWLVIQSPDPSQNPQPPNRIIIGLADGTIAVIDADGFDDSLRKQNTLRTDNGLPPLPSPETVLTHTNLGTR